MTEDCSLKAKAAKAGVQPFCFSTRLYKTNSTCRVQKGISSAFSL
ncbi:MAG: hypothetical protein [Olavius algarvensis Delta 4 endosymbiont]|nr:MAG: hypothetical protein [Olavius algarvensis Delta 4 endosymbiont]